MIHDNFETMIKDHPLSETVLWSHLNCFKPSTVFCFVIWFNAPKRPSVSHIFILPLPGAGFGRRTWPTFAVTTWKLIWANIPTHWAWTNTLTWWVGISAKIPWWRHQMETFSASLAFVRGIHRSLVNSPHKGQWRGALVFSLICAWINDWVNTREAADLICHLAHYDVIVMIITAMQKRKCHFDEFVNTGCPGSCQIDTFQCSQFYDEFHNLVSHEYSWGLDYASRVVLFFK